MSTPTTHVRTRPAHELNPSHFTKIPTLTENLAAMMLEAADTQEPGTPLYGYPGGSPEAEAVQLGILTDECVQAGFHPDIVAGAGQLVLQAWAERRQDR